MTIIDYILIFFGRHAYGVSPEEETVLARFWFIMGIVVFVGLSILTSFLLT